MTRNVSRNAGRFTSLLAAVALVGLAPAVAAAQTTRQPPAKAAAQERQAPARAANTDPHRAQRGPGRGGFQVAERADGRRGDGPRAGEGRHGGKSHDVHERRSGDDRGEHRRG